MNRFLGLIIALSVILFSCNESTKDKIIKKFQSDSYESLMEDSISLMEDIAETWEDVDDKDSFKAAEADMNGKFTDAQEAITERGKALEESLSEEDNAKIGEEMMEKYGDEMEKVVERMMKASMSAAQYTY